MADNSRARPLGPPALDEHGDVDTVWECVREIMAHEGTGGNAAARPTAKQQVQATPASHAANQATPGGPSPPVIGPQSFGNASRRACGPPPPTPANAGGPPPPAPVAAAAGTTIRPRGAFAPAGLDLRIHGRSVHGVHMCPITRDISSSTRTPTAQHGCAWGGDGAASALQQTVEVRPDLTRPQAVACDAQSEARLHVQSCGPLLRWTRGNRSFSFLTFSFLDCQSQKAAVVMFLHHTTQRSRAKSHAELLREKQEHSASGPPLTIMIYSKF